MLSALKYKQLLEDGLSADHYHVLNCIHSGAELPDHPRVEGFRTLLEKKGYLIEGILTDKAFEFIEEVVVEQKEDKMDFNQWAEYLLKSMKAELKKHIKREQIVGFGGIYFIPGLVDLKDHLLRFMKKYDNLFDRDKTEKILLQHIKTCCETGKFAPAVKYYIIKDKSGSQLAAALENYEEPEQEGQFQIVNTKNLF